MLSHTRNQTSPCLFSKGLIKGVKNGWPNDPNGKPDWLKDNWLTFGVQATFDLTGMFSIMMYMDGMWINAMGIPTFNLGDMWARLSVHIPTCQAAIASAAATGGAGLIACVGGIGGGGKAVLGTIEVEVNAYLSIAEPQKIWGKLAIKDLTLSSVATLALSAAGLNDKPWAEKVTNGLASWGGINKLDMEVAAFSGSIGDCPGDFPVCIKFKAGGYFDGSIEMLGVKVTASIFAGFTPPDAGFGFSVDASQLFDMIEKWQKKLFSVLPWGEEMIAGMEKMLKTLTGIELPTPIFRLNSIAMSTLTLSKFFTNKEAFKLAWDFVVLGNEQKGSIEFKIGHLCSRAMR